MMLSIGETVTRTLTLTQAQFDRFAALSGDDNPIHVDPAFAARTRFGRTVAHGMFLYANIHRALGEQWPGAIGVRQELVFSAPTYADEPVELRLAAREPIGQTLVGVDAEVAKSDGRLGCQAGATVQLIPLFISAAPLDLPSDTSGDGWRGLAVGQSVALRRAYSAADLDEYVDLLGETNPLHVDAAFAHRAGLRGRLLPGPLLGALFSCLLGTELPGRGTNWLKQRLIIRRHVYPGDELEARVEITRLRPDKELVNLRTWITRPDGAVACDGEALVWAGDLERG